MNETAIQAMDLVSNKIILFVLSMVGAYIFISLTVYKTKLSKNAKEFVTQILSVTVFGCLGYFFTVIY